MGSLNMYSMLVFLTLTAAMALPVTEEEVRKFDYAGEAADDTAVGVEKTPVGYLKHKPSRPGYGYKPGYNGYPVSGYTTGSLIYPSTGNSAGFLSYNSYPYGYNGAGYNTNAGYYRPTFYRY